jgi:hypothetical protein
MSYPEDSKWASEHHLLIQEVIEKHLGLIVRVQTATDEQDRHQATDYVVDCARGRVAVRLRRPSCRWRDLTIRSRRASGVPTELHKIRAGCADYYFYGWQRTGGAIGDHVLIDLGRVRSLRLLDGRKEKMNEDGVTWFIKVPIDELREAGCLLVDECRCGRPDNPPRPLPLPPPAQEKDKKPTQGLLFPGFGGPP